MKQAYLKICSTSLLSNIKNSQTSQPHQGPRTHISFIFHVLKFAQKTNIHYIKVETQDYTHYSIDSHINSSHKIEGMRFEMHKRSSTSTQFAAAILQVIPKTSVTPPKLAEHNIVQYINTSSEVLDSFRKLYQH